MILRSISLLLALLASGPTAACSFANMPELFRPSSGKFERKLDGELLATLPAPIVHVLSIGRGSEAPGASCEDAGTISLKVEWPNDSLYTLSEVGFYFRIVEGTAPDAIFPNAPIRGLESGDTMEFFFAWLDGHPSGQKPLNLVVEVFAVNKGQEIGPSTRFRVKADRG